MAAGRTLRLALFAAAMLGGAAHAACSKKMTMAAEEWPPYTFTAGGKYVGMDVDVARAVFKEAGCELNIGSYVPTPRRELLFKTGKFDIMLAASDTPARRQFAMFSLPYRDETVALFALDGTSESLSEAHNLEQVFSPGWTMLVPRQGWYGEEYARMRPALKENGRLFEFGSIAQGIQMLKARRANFLMSDSASVLHAARAENVVVRQLSFVLYSAPVHFMLSKATVTKADLDQLNAAITRLERNGTLKAIRESWHTR